jgi:short-subunit dehydrogenase
LELLTLVDLIQNYQFRLRIRVNYKKLKMSKRDFKNKTVIITGATGNLGSELCMNFGLAGAKVCAIDLNEENLKQLAADLKTHNIEIFTQICDITNKKLLSEVITNIKNEFGNIDVLINNAGITHIQRFNEIEDPEKVLRRIMEVNVFAAVNCCHLVMDELLKNRGMIINISSVAGFAPLLGRTAYSASKHALQGYFESLRTELYQNGVQCLTVCPSFIGADPNRAALSANDHNSVNQKKKLIGKALDPKFVAEKILIAARQNKANLIVGKTALQSYFMHRFFPNIYERLMRNKLSKEL